MRFSHFPLNPKVLTYATANRPQKRRKFFDSAEGNTPLTTTQAFGQTTKHSEQSSSTPECVSCGRILATLTSILRCAMYTFFCHVKMLQLNQNLRCHSITCAVCSRTCTEITAECVSLHTLLDISSVERTEPTEDQKLGLQGDLCCDKPVIGRRRKFKDGRTNDVPFGGRRTGCGRTVCRSCSEENIPK